MMLIVGGAYVGKRAYAATLGYRQRDMSDSVTDDAPVLLNLQRIVREAIERGEEADALLPALLGKAVVICDEVGSGVIPMDAMERRAREATGRLCAALAREADTVVRVVCGLPIAIKGALP